MAAVAGATTVWRRSETALARVTPRSVLLMTSPHDETLRIEGSAVVVWSQLKQPATDAQLVRKVAARLAVAPAEVETFVLAALETLAETGAIVGSDD